MGSHYFPQVVSDLAVVGLNRHRMVPPTGLFPAPDFYGDFLVDGIVETGQSDVQIRRFVLDELQVCAADATKCPGNVFG